jgi:predicted nucleic acid-binding protein
VSQTWLIDTGPLVALLVATDDRYAWAVDQLHHAPATVLTCDAVISEALFLLKREGHDCDDLFALAEAGFLRSEFKFTTEHPAIRKLMRRYTDQPMSFADACLVCLTEKHPAAVVWTLDHDFRVYRQHGRQTIPLVIPT